VRFARLGLVLLSVVAMAALLAAPSGATTQPAFRVIVNPGNPTGSIERRTVADAFLKKTTRWPDGSLIRPVDLGGQSPTRQRFSEDILGRSVSAVRSYWQQLVFSGRDLPPPELDTDEEVIRYVLRYAGAIGYVSGGGNVENVKVLSVR
jgi:ABC-type phosphate transport system substrate-binding protein